MSPGIQLILTISSAAITLLTGIVVTVIGFVVKNQIERIDKHDDILNSNYKELSKDISAIRIDVAAIKATCKTREGCGLD